MAFCNPNLLVELVIYPELILAYSREMSVLLAFSGEVSDRLTNSYLLYQTLGMIHAVNGADLVTHT